MEMTTLPVSTDGSTARLDLGPGAMYLPGHGDPSADHPILPPPFPLDATSSTSLSPSLGYSSGSIASLPLRPTLEHHSHPHKAVRTFAGGLLRYWTDPTVVVSADWNPHLLQRWQSYTTARHWEAALQLHLFRDVALYKAASVECIATLILTYMVLTIVTGILNHTADYSYFPTAIAVWHIPLIAFMILATGATSGGHLNPMISFSTCLAGLTEFPRMALYIPAQVLGAIIAGYIVKHQTPAALLHGNQLGMCSIGIDQSPAEALTLEIFGDLFVLFVAFGVALDERQRQTMPGWLPPFIISTMIALLIYTTSTISRFGTGAIAFPTRCFAPAVAMGLLSADSFVVPGPDGDVVVRNAQWIYWVGPFCASCIVGLLYRVVPPGYTVCIAQQRSAGLQGHVVHK